MTYYDYQVEYNESLEVLGKPHHEHGVEGASWCEGAIEG